MDVDGTGRLAAQPADLDLLAEMLGGPLDLDAGAIPDR
jgi:hypothetical protein